MMLTYDSNYYPRWRSLVHERPAQGENILCAIKLAGGEDEREITVCAYDSEQHSLTLPSSKKPVFGDWIKANDIHWTEVPYFEAKNIVPSDTDRKTGEEFLLRQVDGMLSTAHDILIDVHHSREKAGEFIDGDAVTSAFRDAGNAIQKLRDAGESPDYLAAWERS